MTNERATEAAPKEGLSKTQDAPVEIGGVPINPIPWDGKDDTRPSTIAPGLYSDHDEVFRRCPGRSKSAVKDVLPPSTPAHYIDKRRHPGRYPPTDAMVLGRYLHAMMFEPDVADKFFVTPEGFTLRGNDNKEQMERWKRKYGADNVLHGKEARSAYELAKEIAANVQSRPYLKSALSGGVSEICIFWRDEETGALCKTKADYVKWAGKAFVVSELKTATDIDPEKVRRNSGPSSGTSYLVDATFTTDGVAAATGLPAYPLLIPMLKKPPYLAQEYEFSPELMARARAHYRWGIKMLAYCYENDVWESYSSHPLMIDSLPPWEKFLGEEA